VKFDPVIVARQLWEYTRLKGAPGHRRLGTPLADATPPAAGDTEDGTVGPKCRWAPARIQKSRLQVGNMRFGSDSA
jgi:hypothetical protein